MTDEQRARLRELTALNSRDEAQEAEYAELSQLAVTEAITDETPAPAPGSLHNLTPAATAPFNRPPRPGKAPAADALIPPSPKDVPPAG